MLGKLRRGTVDTVTGTSHVTIGIKSGPATATESFFGIAQGLMPGVQALLTAKNSAIPLVFISCHVTECLLKSYLTTKGVTDKALRSPRVRHNLEELWRMCVTQGLPVDPTPPPWVTELNGLHDGPAFLLRYPMGINGFSFSPLAPIVQSIELLLETVRQANLGA